MDGNKTVEKWPPRGVPNQNTKERLSRNWYLLAGVTVSCSIGMAIAVSPLFGYQFIDAWPWANTHFILLGGLALSVTLLVVHLTIQQRKLLAIRQEVDHLEEDSFARKRENKQRLDALLNISSMMGSVPNKDKLFNFITDTCLDLFNSEYVSLMLNDKEKEELKVRATSGRIAKDEETVAVNKSGGGLSGWVAKTRIALLLSPGVDVNRYPGLDISALDVTAAMVVPILLRDELTGILSVKSRLPGSRYNDEDLQALQVFAENVGTAIRHSEHVEWMRKTIDQYKTKQPGSSVTKLR